MIIAFQGAPGAYSEAAANKLYPTAHTLSCHWFPDVVTTLLDGAATYAILPYRNSLGGVVEPMLKAVNGYELFVAHQIDFPIHHCLLGIATASLTTIKTVHSHYQALRQCQRQIKELDLIEVEESDTAGAAALIAKNHDPNNAAIASAQAAAHYGLKILRMNFADHENNVTSFVVVEKNRSLPEQQTLERFLQIQEINC